MACHKSILRRHCCAMCEAESSEPVYQPPRHPPSLDLWREYFPQTPFNGSLVVDASARTAATLALRGDVRPSAARREELSEL